MHNTVSTDRKTFLVKLTIISVLLNTTVVFSVYEGAYVIPALVVLGLLAVFVMHSLERSIYLVPFLVVFSYSIPFLEIGSRTVNLRFDYIFLAILIGVWLMRKALTDPTQFRQEIDFKKPLIIFTVFQGISAIRILLTYGYIDAVLFLIIWIEYLFIFFILTDVALPISKIKHLFYLMLIIANVAAIYGVVDHLSTGGIRIASIFSGIKGSANVLGIYLVLFILFSICFALYFRGSLRLLMIASALNLSVVLAFTLSRSSWVALAAGIFVIGILEKRSIFLWALLALSSVALFFPEIIVHRAESIIEVVSNPKVISAFLEMSHRLGEYKAGAIEHLLGQSGFNVNIIGGGMRYVAWIDALNLFERFPMLGSGIFTISHFGRVSTTESLYLEVLSGTGILGSIAFLWFGVKLTQYAINAYRRVEAGFGRCFVSGYLATLVALGTASITGNVALSPKLLGVFWVLTGLLVKLRESDQPGGRFGN